MDTEERTGAQPALERVRMTRGDCLLNLFADGAMGLVFAFLCWDSHRRGADEVAVWGNAFLAVVALGLAVSRGQDYRRLRRGESVYVSRLPRWERWMLTLVGLTVVLIAACCSAIAVVVNHPHSHRAWSMLAFMAPLWGILLWGWRYALRRVK